jgi:hypothetical protein
MVIQLFLSTLTPYVDEITRDLDVINQLLTTYLAYVTYWRNNERAMALYDSYLLTLKKTHISLTMELF